MTKITTGTIVKFSKYFAARTARCRVKSRKNQIDMDLEEWISYYSTCPICSKMFNQRELVKKLSRKGCKYAHQQCYDRIYND
jgi:hypothetical protein